MNNSEDKKVNNISIVISGIIIASVVLLVGMLIDFIEINIILPEIVIFLMRPLMYAITIIFTQILIEKVNKRLKNPEKF